MDLSGSTILNWITMEISSSDDVITDASVVIDNGKWNSYLHSNLPVSLGPLEFLHTLLHNLLREQRNRHFSLQDSSIRNRTQRNHKKQTITRSAETQGPLGFHFLQNVPIHEPERSKWMKSWITGQPTASKDFNQKLEDFGDGKNRLYSRKES